MIQKQKAITSPAKKNYKKIFGSITKILQKMKKSQKINCANIENKNMADMATEKKENNR